ncbi:MAG TPA: TrbC/VirB2 family protein [Candidatus Scatovivens faecipullorum]|mgnify:CR=1 FL=1|nr:TrbC/VirB2 family protein [Candidatus Scatovivens faecipullorum]
MRKIIYVLTIIILFSMIFDFYSVYADDGVDSIITAMEGTSNAATATGTGVGNVINNVIGIMQVVGSGLSIIVITLLGIKYILASPGEKADVKKSIMPILIGCVLLFGAVNLIAAVEEFSKVLN